MHEVQLKAEPIARLVRPTSLEGALVLLHDNAESARLLAGGTDLLLEVQRRVRSDISLLIDVTRIQGLDQITESNGEITLGALVTHSQTVASSIVVQFGLPLAQACFEIGSPQLRNRATIAGNLVTASPANDTISALWALDASLVLQSIHRRRKVAVRDFYLGVRETVLEPDEMVTHITFPALNEQKQGVFVKAGLRKAQAISIVHMAAVLEFDDGLVTGASIALGSVAPTIVAAPTAEAALVGRILSEDVVAQAASAVAADIAPIDDGRATAEYRKDIVSTMLTRALRTVASGQTRVEWNEAQILLGPAAGIMGEAATLVDTAADATVSALVNGETLSARAAPDQTLLDWLGKLGLTGSKEGCAEGECGACTVWVDDAAVMSCLAAAPSIAGSTILTIEGLAQSPSDLHPLQTEFINHGAVQCGFCIPGIVMAAARLLKETPRPTATEVKRALAGNLCRCTGYYKIVDAVLAASGMPA